MVGPTSRQEEFVIQTGMATRNAHTVNRVLGQELYNARIHGRRGPINVGLAIGVTRSTVLNMESARQGIRISQFLDWCDYLGVDPAKVIAKVAERTRP